MMSTRVMQAIDSASLEAGTGGTAQPNPVLDSVSIADSATEKPPTLLAAWRQQFVEAIEYDSKTAEDGEEPGGVLGLIMHFMSIFWKLCVATVPPPWWMGGWPCFFGSLLWIIAQVRGDSR